jgi:hypothetical protein
MKQKDEYPEDVTVIFLILRRFTAIIFTEHGMKIGIELNLFSKLMRDIPFAAGN